jgi:hypothetical protein
VQRLHLSLARSVAAALAVLAGSSGFAQDIRIDVTGSNIKRIEGEGALPVTVITREQIDRSGATTPMELLQQISANNSVGATTLSERAGRLQGDRRRDVVERPVGERGSISAPAG